MGGGRQLRRRSKCLKTRAPGCFSYSNNRYFKIVLLEVNVLKDLEVGLSRGTSSLTTSCYAIKQLANIYIYIYIYMWNITGISLNIMERICNIMLHPWITMQPLWNMRVPHRTSIWYLCNIYRICSDVLPEERPGHLQMTTDQQMPPNRRPYLTNA